MPHGFQKINFQIVVYERFFPGREEHLAVYYTSPQSIQRFLFVGSLVTYYWILIGWFFKLSVQMCQRLIVIYRRGNFVYHPWGCTSIYRSLSYPFRSLDFLLKSNACINLNRRIVTSWFHSYFCWLNYSLLFFWWIY